MHRKYTIRLFAIAATLGICSTLSAANYTWNFTGSNVTQSVGNSITFNASPTGGPTVKATAWYIDSAGLFQKATIGRYSHGLGVCYPGESCSNPNHQSDNSGYDDFIMLEFSSALDPTTARVTTTSSTSSQRDTDVSFWLGGATSSQNLNLTGTSVAGLTGLGFGSRVDDNGANLAQNGYRDVSIAPVGQYVNKMIFGAKYLDGDDFFKITSLGGSTWDGGGGGSVPEPSSIVLFGTVGLVVLRVLSKRARATSTQPIQE